MPDNQPATNPGLTFLFWWLLGPLYQLYTLLGWLLLRLQVQRLNREADQALRELGRRMAQIGFGDELSRQRVAAADTAARDNPSVAATRNADQEAYNLGKVGMSASVPIKNAEVQYLAAHETENRAQEAISRLSEKLSTLWPSTALGWLAMIIGYVTYMLLIYLVWTYYLFPAAKPVAPPA
jgi:hypothetical protein